MAEEEIEQAIVDAENMLLDPRIRSDHRRVDQLLDPRFREIGQSGWMWGREEMIDAMLSGGVEVAPGLTLQHPHVEKLAADLYLLTYLLDTEASTTRRSSIWDVSSGSPRVVFHQGTRIPPAPEP